MTATDRQRRCGLTTSPPRVPTSGQVLVRVAATSVNLSDWETLRGSPMYARLGGLRSPARRTLGSDIAGWVETVRQGRDSVPTPVTRSTATTWR